MLCVCTEYKYVSTTLQLMHESFVSTNNMCRAWMTEIVGASSGKLSGKTLAVKDNIHIAGVPMSCGSNFLRGFVSSCTATAVSRILDAGHMKWVM